MLYKKDYDNPFSTNCHDNPEVNLNTTEIIRRWGYTGTEYLLETEDLYKILLNRAYKHITKKSPVLLAHGIGMNSLGFVNRGNKSYAHYFANEGYDVWILNFRGTKYSRGHTNLSVNDNNYWTFSFHEMAIYDLRTIINFIYNKTKQKISYIGFSMGTTTSYIYSLTFPEEAKSKLIGIVSLAPVAYLSSDSRITNMIIKFLPIIKSFLYTIKHGELLSSINIPQLFCTNTEFQLYACETVKGLIFGADFDQLDPVDLPLINSMNFGSICIEHYSQFIQSGLFQNRDFGEKSNMEKYGTPQPPMYNLSKISVPVALIIGRNDPIATEANAVRLYSELSNKSNCVFKIVPYDKWSHSDFIEAKDIEKYLLRTVLQVVENMYNENC